MRGPANRWSRAPLCSRPARPAGTSFSEVLEATGAPRGSVYHHFPGGKDQLVKAALDWAAAYWRGPWTRARARRPKRSRTSSCRPGVAFSARSAFVWLRGGRGDSSNESPELLEHTSAIFRTWRDDLQSSS